MFNISHLNYFEVKRLDKSAKKYDVYRDSLTRTFMSKMHGGIGSSGTLSKDSSPEPNKSPSNLMESSVISDPGFSQSTSNRSKFRATAATVVRTSRAVDRLKVSFSYSIILIQLFKLQTKNANFVTDYPCILELCVSYNFRAVN